MKEPYLEVTYCQSKPIAAYLYLPRETGERSYRTSKAEAGMIIDFGQRGNPIGIEITAPTKVTIADLNHVLAKLGVPLMQDSELAPLRAT
jgi:uncharacterized protein YuzE